MVPPHIPVLLLKTRSNVKDVYEDHFSRRRPHISRVAEGPGLSYKPIFVPVLEHRPSQENLQQIRTIVRNGKLSDEYGGLVFTSQRAVEGFAGVIAEIEKVDKDDTAGSGDGERDEGGMVCPSELSLDLASLSPSVI